MAGRPVRRARGGPAPSVGRGPATGRSWPPFEEGNTAARRNGVYREAELRPVAEQLAAELVDVAPWTRSPAFAATVERWAWAEAASRAYRAWFAERGLFTDDGEARPGQERWARFEATAAKAAETLGLSPLALGRLLGTLAVTAAAGGDEDTLEQLRAEGRRILAARGELVAGTDEETAP